MQIHNGKATASFVLGIVSMLAWIIPLFGFPVSIVGLIMGVKGMQSEKKGFDTTGLILSIVVLVFCTANAAIGAYMSATGQSF